MVRGRRWPVERWRELFTGHPMMVPFGVKLVWGAYVNSVLKQTFRALEDGSLTDFDDEEVTLPEGCEIGIVHPLELDEETRERWKTHLEDYEIAPPFAQMARPVVMVSDDDAKTVFYAGVVGAMMNGLTFKGRAERMGWRRGSVCDAGSITAYAKSFPSAGVDAFLLLDDMFVGIDMYSEIALGVAFFVTTGSVKIGSYEYDEPTSESDPRLVRFGQVPPIVFSEVMGDLSRIAAGQQEE
jgi:hypothetical protein